MFLLMLQTLTVRVNTPGLEIHGMVRVVEGRRYVLMQDYRFDEILAALEAYTGHGIA